MIGEGGAPRPVRPVRKAEAGPVFVVGERGAPRSVQRRKSEVAVVRKQRAPSRFGSAVVQAAPVEFDGFSRGMMWLGGLLILLVIASPHVAPMTNPGGVVMVGVALMIAGGVNGLIWRSRSAAALAASVPELPDDPRDPGEYGGGDVDDRERD